MNICTKSFWQYTLLAKKVVTPPLKTIKPMWIELLCFHLAWYGPVIVPQRNPTLPWADIQCKVKWDRRAPKPQYRWSFLQINLHTVTTLNQYLHTTVNNRLLSRGYRAYRPTTKPLLTANHRRLRLEWAQRWWNLTVAHRQHVIFSDVSRFQLYPVDGRLRVRRLPGERFRPGCQAHRVQAGGSSVHVWGAFHNSAKSPLVLPDGYLTGVPYRGILQNTLVPFARHYFGDNYRYQDDNATSHRARVVLDFLQQGNVTKMEQPPRTPDCNPIEHLWDELGRAISSMDNPPQNLDELRQALLDKWAQIPVQRLQRLVASMPRRLAAIIAARGGNTRYWPGTHKTRPPGSVTKKNHLCFTKFTTIIFQWHLGMHIWPITHFIIKCRQNCQNTTE